MLITSNLISKMSGSINGLVGSHGRGGMYFRARSTPTNPSTPQQQVIRNANAVLSAAWSNTLTQAQRDAWTVYAANQPLTNKLGESKNIPPMAHFSRANVPRIQAGLTTILAAPVVYTLPAFTITSVGVVAATDLISIAYPAGDLWTGNGGGLLVWCSRPQSVGIVYFKNPYRFAGSVDGAVVPPVSPQTLPTPFPYTTGQKFFVRIRASNPDGRLSSEQFFSGVAS